MLTSYSSHCRDFDCQALLVYQNYDIFIRFSDMWKGLDHQFVEFFTFRVPGNQQKMNLLQSE